VTQISMEAAFPTFQKKCSELFDANMLLQAQVDVQERELAALREENERLKQGTEPAPSPDADLAPLRSVGEEG
jgi:hypothetical protein